MIRQNIDKALLVLSKGNLEAIVVSNFEACHKEGESVSKMWKQMTSEERKIIKWNFIINKKNNEFIKKNQKPFVIELGGGGKH